MCIIITVEETISIKLDLMQHGIGKETKHLKNKYTWYLLKSIGVNTN